jgi:hypothetical protein
LQLWSVKKRSSKERGKANCFVIVFSINWLVWRVDLFDDTVSQGHHFVELDINCFEIV